MSGAGYVVQPFGHSLALNRRTMTVEMVGPEGDVRGWIDARLADQAQAFDMWLARLWRQLGWALVELLPTRRKQQDDAMTWNDIAASYPEFVQWIVQKYGPLPDGEVQQEDYERFVDEYEAAT